MNRRSFLTALPALAVAPAIPAAPPVVDAERIKSLLFPVERTWSYGGTYMDFPRPGSARLEALRRKFGY